MNDRKFTTERLGQVRELLKNYMGTHNYWNYTVGLKHNDAQATRYMKDLTVRTFFSSPIVDDDDDRW